MSETAIKNVTSHKKNMGDIYVEYNVLYLVPQALWFTKT